MRKTLQIAGLVLLVGFIYLCGYGVYCWLTYIDETITTGDAYGFCVGDSKLETYQRAGQQFQEKTVWFAYPPDYRQAVVRRNTTFSDDEFDLLALGEQNKWQLYFGSFFDTIQLSFTNDRLVEIYRHRQKFELP